MGMLGSRGRHFTDVLAVAYPDGSIRRWQMVWAAPSTLLALGALLAPRPCACTFRAHAWRTASCSRGILRWCPAAKSCCVRGATSGCPGCGWRSRLGLLACHGWFEIPPPPPSLTLPHLLVMHGNPQGGCCPSLPPSSGPSPCVCRCTCLIAWSTYQPLTPSPPSLSSLTHRCPW
jgi:hypothetical protein